MNWRPLAVAAISWFAAMNARAANVTATTVIDPPQVGCGGTARVNLTLTGEDTISSTPTDIVLVIDDSGSINYSQFQQVKNFALGLVSSLTTAGLYDNGGRMGLVLFSDAARTLLPLSTVPQDMQRAIATATSTAGWTCTSCGVNAAQSLLAGSEPDHAKMMIVLTDGQSNRPVGQPTALSDAVAAAKAAGTTLFSIGVGTQISVEELTLIASAPEYVFRAADFSALAALLTDLIEAVTLPGSTDVTVSLTLAPHFSVSEVSSTHGPAVADAGILTWTVPSLGSLPAELGFAVTHDSAQRGGAESPIVAATYADAEGSVVTLELPQLDVTGCLASIVLTPSSIALRGGETAAFVASVADDFGGALAGVPVSFAVTSGPNAGVTGLAATDGAGDASFAYSGSVLGTDTLVASAGAASATAEVTWQDSTPPVVTCTSFRGDEQNGWFTLSAVDDQPGAPVLTVNGLGPFPSGTTLKITVAKGAAPKRLTSGKYAHLLLAEEPLVTAVDAAGNVATATCR